MYQLSRHLEIEFDTGSSALDVGRGARYILKNALTGTQMLCHDQDWELLESYESPRNIGTSPLETRARQANILSLFGEEPIHSELATRFETLAQKLLQYRHLEPAADVLGMASQLKEACGPTLEFEMGDHYLWADPKRLFHIMMDHISAYLRLELVGSQVFPMSLEFARQSLGRPQRNGEFAQQLCTLHTSLKRARYITERFPAPAKFLTLGDDDLMSLAISQYPGYEIDVFEIDRSLVRFIKKRKNDTVRVFSRDLSAGLPEEFHGLYDAVLADPPYDQRGMEWFVGCCSTALKHDGQARLYLSTYPDLLESADDFFLEFPKNGLRLCSTQECFNRYPFPSETHQITKKGLNNLGYHPDLVSTIMDVPYLYAHLYECVRV